MKIVVAYIAVSQGILTHDYCARFVGSWLANPPGVDCSLIVACNGGPLPLETALMFDPLGAQFLPRENDGGFDLSAYHDIAGSFPCDLLVCQGESIYYHRAGWLKRIADTWAANGPGMYGMFSSNLVRPHLNTTGFAISPELLLQYPKPSNKTERYIEEHGERSLWKHVQGVGRRAMLVTWDGAWFPFQWRAPRNIMWRGDQSNLLAFCNHTDRYRAADHKTRLAWERWINQAFK